MVMKTWLLLILLLAIDVSESRTLLSGDGTENRINFVIVGDGFTADYQDSFNALADTVLNAMRNKTPFREYLDFFNVYRLNLISQDSGINDQTAGIFNRNTALGVTWSGGHFNCEFQMTRDMATDSVPGWKAIIIIANIGNGEGTAYLDGFAFISTKNTGNAAMHELGHAFGQLADEYAEGRTNTSDREPNITFETNRDKIKWKAWILPTTPIPTPDDLAYSDHVGIFEGAKQQTKGIYRSEIGCMMRGASGWFCRICTETLVLKIHEMVKEIQGTNFPSGWVNFSDSPIIFSVGNFLGSPKVKYKIEWLLDGSIKEGVDGTSLTLNPWDLGTWNHNLIARVIDTTHYNYPRDRINGQNTPFVRTDTNGYMADSIEWNLVYGISRITAVSGEGATGTLRVSLFGRTVGMMANARESGSIRIYDLHGRVLYEKGVRSQQWTDTWNAKGAGTYFIRMGNEVKRIVVR